MNGKLILQVKYSGAECFLKRVNISSGEEYFRKRVNICMKEKILLNKIEKGS